jgi:hypothetical protein
MLVEGSTLRDISLASTIAFRLHLRHSTSSDNPWRMMDCKLSSIGPTITSPGIVQALFPIQNVDKCEYVP